MKEGSEADRETQIDTDRQREAKKGEQQVGMKRTERKGERWS